MSNSYEFNIDQNRNYSDIKINIDRKFVIKPLRGEKEYFQKYNPIFEDGEMIFVQSIYNDIEDKYQGGAIKFGDGKRRFSDLPYLIKDNTIEVKFLQLQMETLIAKVDVLKTNNLILWVVVLFLMLQNLINFFL